MSGSDAQRVIRFRRAYPSTSLRASDSAILDYINKERRFKKTLDKTLTANINSRKGGVDG